MLHESPGWRSVLLARKEEPTQAVALGKCDGTRKKTKRKLLEKGRIKGGGYRGREKDI